MIHEAVLRGAKTSFDFYPYTGWSSSIHRARFDGNWLERYETDISHVHIEGASPLSREQFTRLSQDPVDRNVNVDSIPQSTVDYFALNTYCPIGTDSPADISTTHPRGAGSFTKFINDYVDSGKIPFPKAIYRFSTQVANDYAQYIPDLSHRGSVEIGKTADLVLWNLNDIKSRATYDNPHEPSVGVVAVFVNGIPVILNGHFETLKEPPGRHLKGVLAR
jgi:N-acyl-D-glutamate deacylase